MTRCRDLTNQPLEAAKKPIEILYYLGEKKSIVGAEPECWEYLDKVLDIKNGRSVIAAYDEEDCPEDEKAFCVGYWNDGVVE